MRLVSATLAILVHWFAVAFAQTPPNFDLHAVMENAMRSQFEHYRNLVCIEAVIERRPCSHQAEVDQFEKESLAAIDRRGTVSHTFWLKAIRLHGIFDESCFKPPFDKLIGPISEAIETATGLTGNNAMSQRLAAATTPEFAWTWHVAASTAAITAQSVKTPIGCTNVTNSKGDIIAAEYYTEGRRMNIGTALVTFLPTLPENLRQRYLVSLMAHEYTHVLTGSETVAYAIQYCIGFQTKVFLMDNQHDNVQHDCATFFSSSFFESTAATIYRDLPERYRKAP